MAEVINNSVYYHNQQRSQPDLDEDRKLFLGGLSWDTTEEDLQDYFGQFGNVSSVSIKYNAATGNPRGFGFITFDNDESINAVLNSGPHSVKNKIIDPRKAKSKVNANLKKIFVGGVDSGLSEDELREYFSRFGRVDGIELPFDKVRNRRREFCFIIFDTKEAADAACGESKQFLGGRECDVKRAQPQNNQRNGLSSNGSGYGSRGGMGSSYGQDLSYQSGSYGGAGYADASSQGWGYQSSNSGYAGQSWNAGGRPGGRSAPRSGGPSGGGFRSRVYGNSGSENNGYNNY
jgi:squid-like protein